MTDLTKKQLSAIRRAAFDAFMGQFSAAELENFFVGGQSCMCYEIEQGDKVDRWIVQYRTQVNDNTIRDAGFDPAAASVHKLFTVNRQTKQLF